MKSEMAKTTVVVNCKGLKGKVAVDLVEEVDRNGNEIFDVYNIILAVQPMDAGQISPVCRVKIFIQDIFSEEPYCFLNFFKNETTARRNVSGVMLNHPEKRLSESGLAASVRKARQLDMETLICATTIEEGMRLSKYAPRFIGIENEELIGKNISFVDHCPEIVRQAKEKIGNDILIGAGIRSSQDLKHVVNAGGAGVLVSSLVLKSSDPINALLKLLN